MTLAFRLVRYPQKCAYKAIYKNKQTNAHIYAQNTYQKKITTIERMFHFGMSSVCTVKKKKKVFYIVYSPSPVSHCHSEYSTMMPLLNIQHIRRLAQTVSIPSKSQKHQQSYKYMVLY